jgi:integrase
VYIKSGTDRWWFSVKIDGRWRARPTPYAEHEREQAERYIVEALKALSAHESTAGQPDTGPPIVNDYGETWATEREARGVGAAMPDLRLLRRYAFSVIGHLPLPDVKPRHARDIVRAMRTAGERAPRTIIHVRDALRAMFESAIVDEYVGANPIKLKPGELPKKVDKDRNWRSQASFATREVEQLISDARIPVERRVQYAYKAIAGMRHGEVAALRWRSLDYTADPLTRINVTEAYSSATRTVGPTKTKDTRSVPMHPTLAAITAAWRLEHWPRIYGRMPGLDDFVVPTRTMAPVKAYDAVEAFKRDLETLGLRVEAGEHRDRGGHDLRSWFLTATVECGCESLVLRRTTHAAPGDILAGYQRFGWGTMCREISKLKISILGGEVLALPPGLPPGGKAESKRWKQQDKISDPNGIRKAFCDRHRAPADIRIE